MNKKEYFKKLYKKNIKIEKKYKIPKVPYFPMYIDIEMKKKYLNFFENSRFHFIKYDLIEYLF